MERGFYKMDTGIGTSWNECIYTLQLYDLVSLIHYNLLYKHIYLQDTQWADIDYMDAYKDWTLDPNKFADLPAVVNDLHSYGMHFIPIVVCFRYL